MMPACPVHHVIVDSTGNWDGPAQEKKFDGSKPANFPRFYAWIDKGEHDPDATGTDKEDAWGPHHECNAEGIPGAANLKGVESAMGALNGAHGGASRIPDGDRKAVHAHLAAHYADAGIAADDIPELKSAAEEDSRLAGLAARPELATRQETRLSTGPQFELREVPNGTGGTNLRFTGFASVTGDDAAYEMEDVFGPWTESVSVGAFAKTISDGCDTAFLLNHQGMTLARTKPGTLKLSEVREGNASPVAGVTGLYSEALFDPKNVYVAAMRSAVDRGDLDEMSFGFRVVRQRWPGPNYDRRWIDEIDLRQGDVSLVNFGANPATGGTVTLRQRRPGDRTSERGGRFLHLAPDAGRELARLGWVEELRRDRVRLERYRYHSSSPAIAKPKPVEPDESRLGRSWPRDFRRPGM